MRGALFFLLIFYNLAFAGVPTAADKISDVGLTTVLGSQVSLDTKVFSGDGQEKTVKDFVIPGKPLILMPVYYRCPGLCGITLQSGIALVNDIKAELGKDYSILTFSFNATEPPELAKGKAETIHAKVNNIEAAKKGWHFVTAPQESIDKLLSEVGFKLTKEGEDFAHASAIFVLTPEGTISQYFSGVMFPPWDVKLSLVDASDGKVGSLLHQAVLYCFKFDPLTGKYTLAAWRTMQVGGVITLILMALGFLVLRRKHSS